MTTVTIHVVGFEMGDWKKRVPSTYALELDVRNYIGRGHGKHKKTSALKSKKTFDSIMEKKGAQDCLEMLNECIKGLLKKKDSSNIVIGCAYGRHRSVSIAMSLKENFGDRVQCVYHYVNNN